MLTNNELDLSRGNSSKDSFLFCYTPKTLSIDAFCGCSLRSGIKIVSALLLDYQYAKIGYIFFIFIFLVDTIDFFIAETFIVYGIFHIYSTYPFLMECLFFFTGLFTMFIELYMLWISFCFMVHLKLKRLNIVYGDNLGNLLSQ